MAKRAWSRTFTPRTSRAVKLNINGVPPTLKAKFAAKCRQENLSQRNLVLRWVRNWSEGRRPDDDGTELPTS